MRKFYIVLIVISIWLIGCGTDNPENGNVADNANQNINENSQNTNGENLNVNTNEAEKVEDETVPKFEDADEALKQGTEYFDKNKNQMAIDAFKQAIELNPDLAEAHFKLGVAYALEESADDAKVKEEELANEEANTKKKSKKEKAKKLNSEVAFENAIKAYKKFIAKNPKDAEAQFNLGRAYNKLGDKNDENARKALEQAVKLDDENSLYRTELGAVLIKLAKYPEAIKQLAKAIDLQEDNFRAEDLLEKARDGKKRVDFGANKKE